MRHRAILSLGSNMGDRVHYLEHAIQSIRERCGKVVARSAMYEARALPVPDLVQSNFLNMAINLQTALSPQTLLQELLSIEQSIGRERSGAVRWGPRVIDIDIIDYEGLVSENGEPILPHPRYRERDFVLIPLIEIFPNFKDPESGRHVQELLEHLPREERYVLSVYPLSANAPS